MFNVSEIFNLYIHRVVTIPTHFILNTYYLLIDKSNEIMLKLVLREVVPKRQAHEISPTQVL